MNTSETRWLHRLAVQQHYVTATNAACQFKLLLSIGATPIDLLDDSVGHASMTVILPEMSPADFLAEISDTVVNQVVGGFEGIWLN